MIQDEEAMLLFGRALSKVVTPGAVIFLEGDLGAGKTTLTRGFLRGLGYEGPVKSPTYTLVETYDISSTKINHFDLYRLINPAELDEMGITDYFTDQQIALIEWPEKGEGWLPVPDLSCKIAINANTREIELIADTSVGTEIIRQLNFA